MKKPADKSGAMEVELARAAQDGPVRRVALEVLAELERSSSFAPDVMGRTLRRHRQLHSRERRVVAELVYGVLRLRRRLDALAPTISATDGNERALVRLLTYLIDRHGLLPSEAHAQLALDFSGVTEPERRLSTIADPTEREATRHSLPTWLWRRLCAELGESEAVALATALNLRAPLTLRANTVRTTRAALAERLAAEGVATQETPLARHGLTVHPDTRVNVFGLASFREGLFEVQDEGSQLIAELVAPPPGGRILDACAGAGGKTLAVAAALEGRGRVVAVDVRDDALEELRRRARRAGLSNIRALTIAEEGALPTEVLSPLSPRGTSDGAERILVDAPCSGLGTLRRNPEARWRLSESELDGFAVRQRAILERFAPHVAVGGRLVYATCTVLAIENDEVVRGFLSDHPEYVLMTAREILGSERAAAIGDGSVLRLYPHQHGTDGFFAAVLRRIR